MGQKYAYFHLHISNYKKHIISPGDTKTTRNDCYKQLLAKKLSVEFAVTATVKSNYDNVILKFYDVLNKCFNKKDIVKVCFEKLVELKDDDLDRIVDVTYSSARTVVTKITHYEDKKKIV